VQATLAVGGGFLPVPAQPGADDAPVLQCPPAAAAQPATAGAARTTQARPAGPVAAGTPGPAIGGRASRPTGTAHPAGPARRSLAGAALTPAHSADVAAGYLVRELAAHGHAVPDPFNAGQSDYGTTANAVLALVETRHGSGEVNAALGVLAGHVDAFVRKSGDDQPGALALLVLAAVAGGQNPGAFGGSDLPTRLAATVTVAAPPAHPTPSPTPTRSTPPVAGGADPGATLPDTGADSRARYAGALGASLLLVGAALVAFARRTRRA
jgi:LPXTG-motif cell wall-anchored protein